MSQVEVGVGEIAHRTQERSYHLGTLRLDLQGDFDTEGSRLHIMS